MERIKRYWKLWIACLLLLAVAFVIVFKVWDRQFRVENIFVLEQQQQQTHLSSEVEAKLRNIVSQQFQYLDRGKQSFAFLSQDQQYVLKFFDTYRIQEHPWWLFCQPRKSCWKKYERLLAGYRVANEYDSDHAALIYLQLAPEGMQPLLVHVRDRFGFIHTIDLSQVPFVIQSAAIPTRVVISDLLRQGKVNEAKKKLRMIVDMYVEEYSRGLYDRDHNVMYNTGFVGDTPIRIDLGRMRKDEQMKNPDLFLKDLKKVAIGRVDGWMGRHFPQYRDEIVAEMHAKLAEVRQDRTSSGRGHIYHREQLEETQEETNSGRKKQAAARAA